MNKTNEKKIVNRIQNPKVFRFPKCFFCPKKTRKVLFYFSEYVNGCSLSMNKIEIYTK